MAITSYTQLHWSDYIVLAAYFLFVITVGIWTSLRNRSSVKGYFLAGQNQHWIPIGASIFASNIGSLHYLGLAGGGASTGFSVSYYELHAVIIVLVLGWIFVPVYMASGATTMPGYLRLRFGGRRIRIFLSVMSLVAYIFTKISVDIYAGTVFIEQAMKLDTYVSIIAIVAIAALFTITGGLTAVIWTDFVQTILMVIGAVILCVLSFIKIGGYSKMSELYHASIPEDLILSNSSCHMPSEEAFHIFKSPLDSDLPWPGALTGAIIKSMWYWCADQVIVQRALAAKNITHAKAGTVFAGVLKLLPLFLLVMPGMIARIIFPETVGCSNAQTCMKVCGSTVACSNIAYSSLVLELMPAGVRGLMLAVMLAALMSSLTSIFNSSSTLFTLDIWTIIRKKATSHEMMVVGRMFVIVLVGVSILWVPLLKGGYGASIFTYTVKVGTFFQPPIIAAFTMAIFTSRVNEKGAFWGMLVGAIIGLTRFALEYSYDVPTCENPVDNRPAIVKDIHFLYFSMLIYIVSVVVSLTISILTKPIDAKHLHRLTFWNRFDKEPRINLPANDSPTSNKEVKDDDIINTSNDVMDEDDSNMKSRPWYKKAGMWLCGIDHRVRNDIQPSAGIVQIGDHESLKQNPTQSWLVNIFAIIVFSSAVFVITFYA